MTADPGLSAGGADLRPALAVAVGGALLLWLLGHLDIGSGQVVAAGAVGWATALAVRTGLGRTGAGRRRLVVVAVACALLSVAVGLGLVWAWSLGEGGVLGPIAYLGERFGWLPLLDLAAAAAAAAVRAA